MKIAIIISTNDSETVFNAFRLANFSIQNGDTVVVFLLGKGVETESISKDEPLLKSQMETFISLGGHIGTCGTCLEIRKQRGTKLCPISTMNDLYNTIKQSDKIINF